MSEKPNGFTGFTVNPSLFHVLMNVALSYSSTFSLFFIQFPILHGVLVTFLPKVEPLVVTMASVYLVRTGIITMS